MASFPTYPAPGQPAVENSVNSRFLSHLNDDQIREAILERKDALVAKHFPGRVMNVFSVAEALDLAGANFTVEKFALTADIPMSEDLPLGKLIPVPMRVTTVRMDTLEAIGVVGPDYGVVQSLDAFTALDILAKRGDLAIRNVHLVNNGAKIRVIALLGTSEFPSLDGAPNTLCHFAVFEATHDGSACTTATVYTLRVECLNGMTSREVVQVHKLRHTSRVSSRIEGVTQKVLKGLIGDAQAEAAIFANLIRKPITRNQFEEFATTLLGELEEEPSPRAVTRRENTMEELMGYFGSGNQGAGETAWGAYNTITRWLEAKRERYEDSVKAAKKFDANLSGDGQKKIARALKLLRKI